MSPRRDICNFLKRLGEHGCPWDAQTFGGTDEAGNLEAIKWLRENGCNWNAETFSVAAKN